MVVANPIFFALAEEQLSSGQRVQLTLSGTSMRPTLQPGDKLTLAPVDHAPAVGDVVLFRYGGHHLLHRVVEVDGDSYTLQGDNCYTTERCRREDIAGLLTEARGISTDSGDWRRLSRRSLRRKKVRNFILRWAGRDGRRQLRPWYFATLAFLMWAPLNGLGIPLDNYVFGLRTDHLIHASVFLPCALFLKDVLSRPLAVWLAALGVSLLSEGVQYLLPYRGFDVNDIVANLIGVSVGFLIILFLPAVRRRHQYPGRGKCEGCR